MGLDRTSVRPNVPDGPKTGELAAPKYPIRRLLGLFAEVGPFHFAKRAPHRIATTSPIMLRGVSCVAWGNHCG